MAKDKVELEVTTKGKGSASPTSGGDKGDKNPFAGIPTLTKEDLLDAFPTKEDFKSIFASLPELTSREIAQTFSKNFDDIFSAIPELTAKEVKDAFKNIGFPENIWKELGNADAFDSSGIKPEGEIAQDEALAASAQSLLDEFNAFGSKVQTVTGVLGALGKGVAIVTGFYVSLLLANQVLKETLNSLGEFSVGLKSAQAQNNATSIRQSLDTANRLDDQLASLETDRGAFARQLEQVKVEVFDLLSPFIRGATLFMTAVLYVLNSMLFVLNTIKDGIGFILFSPSKLIAFLAPHLNPMSAEAKEELKRKRERDRLNKKAPGLGDLTDLFDMARVGMTAKNLPSALAEDVKIPFDRGDGPSGLSGGGGHQMGGGGGF